MATRADVERFAQANRDIRARILADLAGVWGRLDLSDAMAVRAALEEFLPTLVTVYGDIAATVAADFYDDMRDAAGARGAFTAVLADTVDDEAVRAGARWAIGPLFGTLTDAAAQQALGRLEQVADRAALQPGRDTIAASVAKDPAKPRWARVPVGKTCAFCTMLASRGAAYTSAKTAGEGRRFHARCDCTPTPVWADGQLPEGYDPRTLARQFAAAARAADGTSTKVALAELRERHHVH